MSFADGFIAIWRRSNGGALEPAIHSTPLMKIWIFLVQYYNCRQLRLPLRELHGHDPLGGA